MNPLFHFLFFRRYLPIVLFFSFLAFENASAQCPPGDVALNSQSDVFAFMANYPSCTTISGNLSISGADIFNLSGLSALTSVTGNLTIENNNILNFLDGLDNIASVGGNVVIKDNPALSDVLLQDLASVTGHFEITNNDQMTETLPIGSTTLTTLGGNLVINFNDALTTNSGFLGLTVVGGEVVFSHNPQLTSTGLGLSSVGGSVTIFDNDAMSGASIGGLSLTNIPGNLSIQGNAVLTDIDGFAGVQSVSGSIWIWNNPALTALSGLNFNLNSIGGHLEIANNDALMSIPVFTQLNSLGGRLLIYTNDNLASINGFGNLTVVGENLELVDGPALNDISGLSGIQDVGSTFKFINNDLLADVSQMTALNSIGGGLEIWNNDAMTSLAGLDNIASLGGKLEVGDNPLLSALTALGNLLNISGELKVVNNDALTSLSGLENLDYTTITFLTLTGSATLSACSVTSICNYLAAGSPANIGGNAAGCNSETEIENNCGGPFVFTWQGGNGPWNDPANWDCGGCSSTPGPADDVVIDNCAGCGPELAGNVAIAGLSISNGTEINGTGDLTVNGDVTLNEGAFGANGKLTVNNATVDITGNSSVSDFWLIGSTVNQDAELSIGGGQINPASTWESGAVLTVNGNFTNHGTFNLNLSCVCDGMGGSANFDNQGTFNQTSAVASLSLSPNVSTFGTFNIDGTLSVLGFATIAGTVNLANNAVLRLNHSELDHTLDLNIPATGKLAKWGSMAMNINLSLELNGTFEADENSFVTGSGSLTVKNGGNLTFFGDGGVDWRIPVIIEAGGEMDVTAMFGVHSLKEGLTNHGTVNVTNTALIIDAANVANHASWNLDDGGLHFSNAAFFENFGTLSAANSVSVTGGCTLTFTNKPAGQVVKNTASTTLTFDVEYINEGTLTVNAGTVEMNCPFNFAGTIDGAPGTVIDIASGTSNLAPPGGWNAFAENFRMMGYTLGANITLRKSGSGTFTVDGPLTIDGKLELLDGAIAGSSSITVNGSMDWDGGSLNVTTTIAGSASLNVETASAKNLGAALNLDGPTTHTAGALTLTSGGSIANTGTYSFTGGAIDLSGSGTQFTNSGTFNWEGGSLDLPAGTTFANSSGAHFNWDFDATLAGNGTFDNDGSFSTAAGAEFIIEPDVDNSGTMNLDGDFAYLDILGNLTQNGTVNIGDDFFLYLYGGGTAGQPFSFGTDAGLVFDGGIFSLNCSQSVPADGYLDVGLGTINGTGNFSVDGTFTFYDGTLDVPTTINAFGQINLFPFGTPVLTKQLTIEANGFGNMPFGTLQVGTGGSILNNGDFDWQGGTFDLAAGTSFDNDGTLTMSDAFAPPPVPPFSGGFTGTGVFINSGIFQNNLTSAPQSFSFSPTFVNTGVLDQTLPFSTLDFGGGFDNQSAGQVMGVGGYHFNGGLVNDGSFSPGNSPGTLTVSIFENIGATLNIELNAPPFNDRLVVNGPAQLGGNLVVSLFGSFTPAAGDVFTIISASGGLGGTQFNPANITWPTAASDWSIAYQGNDVVIGFQTALPVELIDFHAFEESGKVRLRWRTASETNNRGFELQRSPDGVTWNVLGFVDGQGTSPDQHSYQFLDKKPLAGLNYYRLRQVDLDGQDEHSKIVSLLFDADDRLPDIFPNPAGEALNLRWQQPLETEIRIELADLTGRKRTQATVPAGEKSHRLALNGLPAGVYFLKLRMQDHTLMMQRVVKN